MTATTGGRRPSSLQDSAFSGVRWSGGAHVVKQVVNFGIAIMLVRLLSPEPFGIIGMAAVITGFMTVVSDFGFGSALVQRPCLREAHLSGAFWASVGLGVLLTLAVVAAAPVVREFYSEPAVEAVLETMAPVFLLSAFVVTPKALLQREMDFESIAKTELFAVILAGAIAVSLAWMGAGIWSLVTQRLATPLFEAMVVWVFLDWRPKLRFPLQGVRDLAGYTVNLTGFKLVNYWARHTDDLLIGRVMGSGSLGLYDLGYRLMLFPMRQIIASISRVMFSTLSAIQGDPRRMRHIYLRTTRVLSVVVFPVMAGVAVIPDILVLGLFGEQWSGAIPLIPVFCLVGMIQSLGNPTGWIYTSTGRTDWMMWWGVAGGGTLIAAIVVGIWLGSIESVAWAYAAANAVLLYPMISIPGRLIGMSFTDVVRAAARGLLASVIMAGTLHLLRSGLPSDWSKATMLFVLVPSGAIVYAGATLVVNKAGCVDVLRAAEGILPVGGGGLKWLYERLSGRDDVD